MTKNMWAGALILAWLFIWLGQTPAGQLTKSERKALDAAMKAYKKHIGHDSETSALMRMFPTLPPSEKAKVWLQLYKRSPLGDQFIRNVMIVQGLDAVPILADLVRHGQGGDRFLALEMLCSLDRFLPDDQIPLTGVSGTVRDYSCETWAAQLKHGGEVNPFASVDGHRIGTEAQGIVCWAADQVEDQDLRFHARAYTGLLLQDLRAWPTAAVLEKWTTAVTQARQLSSLPYSNDWTLWIDQTQMILMERPQESIPAMTRAVRESPDPFVRDRAASFLRLVDHVVVRLRGTEEGRQAIEAMCARYRRPDLAQFEKLEEPHVLTSIRKAVWEDVWWFHLPRLTALAFEQYYGEVTRPNVMPKELAKQINPEINRFMTYLTWVDPWFPSWEFTDYGYGWQAAFHPRFKAKMARYYEVWKEFKARDFVLPEAALVSAASAGSERR